MTRAELARYAEAHHVPHVEDATNEKDDMTRNLLRHRVMPVLRAANPRAVENMARTAALLAADEAALHEAAEILLKKAELVPGVSAALPVSALDSTPEAVRSRAVQIAIAARGGPGKRTSAISMCTPCWSWSEDRFPFPTALSRCGRGKRCGCCGRRSPWRHSAFCRGRLFSSALGG